MATINFGTRSEQKAQSKSLDQAMSILQKWAGPIYEQAAKRGFGSTQNKFDPKVTAELMKDVASEGEIWLGAIQGAVQGWQAGGSAAIGANPGAALGKDGKGTNFMKIGQMLGAGAGGFLGSSTMGGGREAGYAAQGALGTIAENAKVWENSGRTRMAQDAIASMGQRMLDLNSPTNPEDALIKAQAKDKLVADTAEQLFAAGIAPDKALQLSASIASIHDPTGRFADIGTRAHATRTRWMANPNKDNPEVKAQFMAEMNALAQEQRIIEGHMPYNMRQFQNQVTQIQKSGQVLNGQGGGAGQVANGIINNFQQGAAAASGGPPLPASVPDALRPSIQPKEKRGTVIDDIVPTINPAAPGGRVSPAGDIGAKAAELAQRSQVIPQALQSGLIEGNAKAMLSHGGAAVSAIDEIINMNNSGMMPSGRLESMAGRVYQNGVQLQGAGTLVGGAIGAVGGGLLAGVPSLGLGTGAGAGIGATVGMGAGNQIGKDLSGMGTGSNMFGALEESDIAGLNAMTSLQNSLANAQTKAMDPGSVVRPAEYDQIMKIMGDTRIAPEERNRRLLTIKEQILTRIENEYAMALSTRGAADQQWMQREIFKQQLDNMSKQGQDGIYELSSDPF